MTVFFKNENYDFYNDVIKKKISGAYFTDRVVRLLTAIYRQRYGRFKARFPHLTVVF